MVILRTLRYFNFDFLEINEIGIVKNVDEQSVHEEGYKKHAFNVLISNQLSYHRDIPNTQNEL